MMTVRYRPFPAPSSPSRPSLFPTVLKQSSAYCAAFGLMVAGSFALASLHADAKAPVNAAASAPLVKPAAGEKLAHKVVTGELGPFKAAQVVLMQSDSIDDAPYTGKVAVRNAAGAVETYALPRPDETEANFMMKVRAVMFKRVDGATTTALIVLHSSTRIGPQQPVEYGACVYQWNGRAFERLAAVEQRLAGVRTAAEVATRLAGDGASDKAGGKP